MTQQEKQINYMGPFITMVFLFFIVGFLTTANTQFQGPLKETFLSEVGGLKNTFATLITFSWFLLAIFLPAKSCYQSACHFPVWQPFAVAWKYRFWWAPCRVFKCTVHILEHARFWVFNPSVAA